MQKKKNIYIYTVLLVSIIILTGLYSFEKVHGAGTATTSNAQTAPVVSETPITPTVSTSHVEQYTITKNFNIIPTNPKANKKIILLTVDDGPSPFTENMIAIFQKHNAKAIFFVNGFHDKGYPKGIPAEVTAGFPVGNHTWDHPNLQKIKEPLMEKEIDENSKLITTRTGTAPRFFRPPYGSFNATVADYVHKNNMILMNWSGAALDWEPSARTEDVFMKNVTSELHPGEILLIHEHPWTLSFLDDLLTMLEKKGYTFADPNNIVQ